MTRATLETDEPTVRATIRALQRGYGEVQRDPESAVAAMLAAEPRLDGDALAAQLDAVAPAFTAGAPAFGALRPSTLSEVGALGRGVRDPQRAARRRARVRHHARRPHVEPLAIGEAPDQRRPSRAMRERGTTRSKPAASARSLTSWCTCE